jgi:hypothetical protein
MMVEYFVKGVSPLDSCDFGHHKIEEFFHENLVQFCQLHYQAVLQQLRNVPIMETLKGEQ